MNRVIDRPAIQSPEVVAKAYDRISEYLHKTPVIYSDTLNNMLGNNFYFKLDAMQKTGAFKIRGVLNHLLCLKEQGKFPEKIVAYSTGNHALAVSYAAGLFGIEARVYLPENVAPIKKKIARGYGCEVIEVKRRAEAEERAYKDSENGYYFMHPSDSDLTIAGYGTISYEALDQMEKELQTKPDYIFAPCGGGGLLSGTYLAKELLSPDSKLIGVEPEIASDAKKSLAQGSLFRFEESPNTVADGLRTLSLTERTFNYIRQLDDFMTVSEKDIYYWTAWLFQLLKVTCEPSCALCMAAAHNMIKQEGIRDKNILILISGGNMDPAFYHDLTEEEYKKAPVV